MLQSMLIYIPNQVYHIVFLRQKMVNVKFFIENSPQNCLLTYWIKSNCTNEFFNQYSFGWCFFKFCNFLLDSSFISFREERRSSLFSKYFI